MPWSMPTDAPTSKSSTTSSSLPRGISYPPFWKQRPDLKRRFGSDDHLFKIANMCQVLGEICRWRGPKLFGMCSKTARMEVERGCSLYYLGTNGTAIGQDLKCPLNDDRVLNILDVDDLDECNEACGTTPNCTKFSVGFVAGEGFNGIGCTQNAVLEPWNGFTVYEVAS